MNIRFLHLLFALSLPCLGTPLDAHAQAGNPLRFGQPVNNQVSQRSIGNGQIETRSTTYSTSNQSAGANMPAEVFNAVYGNKSPRKLTSPQSNIPARHEPPQTVAKRLPQTTSRPVNSTIDDRNVNPAVHVAAPTNNMSALDEALKRLRTRHTENVIASGRPSGSAQFNRLESSRENSLALQDQSSGSELLSNGQVGLDNAGIDGGPTSMIAKPAFDQGKFQRLIKHLAINTGIVLCIGIAFVFIAKQWFTGKAPRQKSKIKPAIQITSTLKLSPKSNLFLVEAGDQRLVIASDHNGIKSVVPLNNSFSDTLDSIADIARSDEFADQDSIASANQFTTETSAADLYSLATVGQAKSAKRTNTMKAESTKAESESQDDVRRKMEAALNDHGLKELFLQTLRSNS